MKKKNLLFVILFMLFSTFAFSASKKNIKLELYADSEKTIDFSKMDSKFEYVTLFYQDIFFNLNLLNSVDKDVLREICIKCYENLKNGYRSLIVVKKFKDNQDLKITFTQMPDNNENLLIMTNYDKDKNLIIPENESRKDSWALLYYLKNEKLVYYKKIDKEELSAQEKIKKNLSDLENEPKPIIYMMVVENYFEMNEIEKGLKYLNENKSKAIKLSPKTSKPGNINDVILCLEEEGKVLIQLIK